MKFVSRGVPLLLLSLVVAFASYAVPVQAASPLAVVHSPPEAVVPGTQIYLTAVLENASSASLAWRNASMAADAVVPMTNLSRASGAGWLYAAYLPAQPAPTQVSYTITARGPAGTTSESFTFAVDWPGASGLTDADQAAWVLTLASSLAVVVCVVTLLYWYTGRRLRREAA